MSVILLSSNSEPVGHSEVTGSVEVVMVVMMPAAHSSSMMYIYHRVVGSQQKGMGYPPMRALCQWAYVMHSNFFMTSSWICVRFQGLGLPTARLTSLASSYTSERKLLIPHIWLWGVPVVLHDSVALLKLLCILDDIVGITQLRVLGPASGGFSIGVLPFPGMVRDANGKPGPGKGAENNPLVLDVHPLLAIQVEGPQVTVDEEVQLGLQLRESGCHGIVN